MRFKEVKFVLRVPATVIHVGDLLFCQIVIDKDSLIVCRLRAWKFCGFRNAEMTTVGNHRFAGCSPLSCNQNYPIGCTSTVNSRRSVFQNR